ncbi:MAG: lamin tail domain-containing protein, partial [Candidatus Magasanikbacteria bacterium]|nr:lamin tail domain-containing protein [Candidatus Magasanikbacteria bacterium]
MIRRCLCGFLSICLCLAPGRLMAQETLLPVAETIIEPIVEPIVLPPVETPIVAPIEPPVDNPAPPIEEPIIPTPEVVTSPATDPIIIPVVEPSAEPISVPISEPIIEPVSPPISPPVSNELIVNEVMVGSEVNPEKDSWIEFYNPTDQEILLDGWQIRGVTKGGSWIDITSEPNRAIQAKDYFLLSYYTNSRSSALEIKPQINKTSIFLNPGAIDIELKEPNGNLSDKIHLDHAITDEFRSYERRLPITDGTLSESWIRATAQTNLKPGLTKTFATPKSPNSFDQPIGGPEEIPIETISNIFINEVLPNPKIRDGENEFIELWNAGDSAVDLKGWELDNQNLDDDQSYFFSDEGRDYILQPDSYLVLYSNETNISLSNLGDSIYLFDVEGNEVGHYDFSPDLTGRSFGRNPEKRDEWITFSHPTPNAVNIELNLSPIPIINIQGGTYSMTLNVTGENSSDPDGDTIIYSWIFEPDSFDNRKNPTGYTFVTPGEKTISLTVTDEFGLSAATHTVFTATWPGRGTVSAPSNIYYPEVQMINEILPDPIGKDAEGEWVELYNGTNKTVDLSGWYLDDAEGKSAPYKIPDNTLVAAHAHRVFTSPELKLSLKNSDDQMRLLDPNKEMKESIGYSGALENWSYAKNGNGIFGWTPILTPGEQNQFPAPPKSYQKKEVTIESIIPNPNGEDRGNEKITFRNNLDEWVNLKTWKIINAKEKTFELPDILLAPRQTVKINPSKIGLELANKSDRVTLFDPMGNEIDQMEWKNIPNGQTLIKTDFLQNGVKAKVLDVIDGDTFKVLVDGMPLTIRMI